MIVCQLLKLYSIFWYDILNASMLRRRQSRIRSWALNIRAVACLQSLCTFIQSKRDCFDEYQRHLRQGIQETGKPRITFYRTHVRRIRRNVRLTPLDYGHAPEASFTPAQHF